MIQIKMWVILFTALIPLITGMLWYNPKVMGNLWMQECGFTRDNLDKGKMPKMLLLTYVLGLLVSFAMIPGTVHQMGFYSMLATPENQNLLKDASSDLSKFAADVMNKYGSNFRTFKHGAFHGIIWALFFATPVIGMGALYEKKSFKYVMIHAGYWIITLALIGGCICQFV